FGRKITLSLFYI
ncbi:General stress protein A, partial [Haemophilus influenzae]